MPIAARNLALALAHEYRPVYAIPTNPTDTPHACSGMTSMACSPVLRIPHASGGRQWSAPMLALGAGYDVIPKLTIGMEIGVSRVDFGSPLNETAAVSWIGLAAGYRF